ncbi:hypothetical protein SAMN02745117_02552, partial [Lampropedia hyalina DSM 16112]
MGLGRVLHQIHPRASAPRQANLGARRRPYVDTGKVGNDEWPAGARWPEGLGPKRPCAALQSLARHKALLRFAPCS